MGEAPLAEDPRKETKMSWIEDRERYQRFAEECEPVAVVGSKEDRFWTVLWWTGAVLTFGLLPLGMPLRRFLRDFGTTFGTRQGYPERLGTLSKRFVAHECRHTTQAVLLGWWFFPLAWVSRRFRAWLGMLPNALLYLLFPLPLGLAAGRFYLELDADRAAWRRGLKEGWLNPGDVREHAEIRAVSLSSGDYLWAWPRPLSRRAYTGAAEAEIHRAAGTASGVIEG